MCIRDRPEGTEGTVAESVEVPAPERIVGPERGAARERVADPDAERSALGGPKPPEPEPEAEAEPEPEPGPEMGPEPGPGLSLIHI